MTRPSPVRAHWVVTAMRQDRNWIAIGYHKKGGKIVKKDIVMVISD